MKRCGTRTGASFKTIYEKLSRRPDTVPSDLVEPSRVERYRLLVRRGDGKGERSRFGVRVFGAAASAKTSTDRIRLDGLCRQPNIVPVPTRAYLYRSLDTMTRQRLYTRDFEYGARYKGRSRSARTSPKVQNELIANDREECHSL